MTPSNAQGSPSSTSQWGPLRGNWLTGISLVGAVAEIGVWAGFSPDRTYQVFYSMPVMSALLLALVLWALFGGGRKRTPLLRRSIAIALVFGTLHGLFRFEEFEGDMIPRFSFRWTPTREEKLKAYLTNSARTAESTSKPDAGTPAVDNTPNVTDASPPPAPRLEIADTDWPSFRGATRDSIVTDPAAKFDWTQAPRELWRHPIGAGWGSFTVVGGFAFTQEQREASEFVVCYEIETGREVWSHEDKARFEEAMAGPGPRATPTIHDSKVFALGATGYLNCLDALTGKQLWQREILKDADTENINWAMSGSPLIVDDVVVVNPGGKNGNGVVAYQQATGEPAWRGGNDRASYAAPKLGVLGETRQILIFDGIGLAGHAADSGRQLWKIDWSNQPQVNAAEPVVLDDKTLLIGSGYDKGGAEIRVTRDGEKWKADLARTVKSFRLKFNAPVVKDGYAYGMDESIMTCLDLKEFKTKWKKGRYGYGQMLLIGDDILVLTEQGEIAIVKANPDRHEETARFPAITGKTWNHPVVWRDLLLVRNGEEVACFRLARQSEAVRR